jgi:uncharacterized protein (TIGR00725 family)
MATRARTITVFGSSRPREGSVEYEDARALGRALAGAGLAVCSGGYGGTREGVSRGAKEGGGRTIAVTAEFFSARANRWVDEEVRVKTWQERLFALIEHGAGYVACKGGTGTLVELAVVWEMLNKRVMTGKPFVVLGEFWGPILERVREVEMGHASPWGEADNRLVHLSPDPVDAANYLAARLSLTSPSPRR